jgi:hypothetical protein
MSYQGGYILNGKYVARAPKAEDLRQSSTSMFKAGDHDRQRKDFAKEIIQPYDLQGKPNEDFIAAFPDESKQYGFIPTDEQLMKEGE